MTALPERLRPWAEALTALHEDLALALTPGVVRLAELFSPPRPGRGAEHGEHHGFDGLSRRGSPERLLMSEWLLALEAPDEFVRRAALGEQAYLRPAFREPRPERHCVVLLDAGPDQMGAPRVAHLALLVVLARRAEAAGAHFAWGVLQKPPPKVLATRVEATSVKAWLRRSHAQPPTVERLAAWRERLEREAGEVWLVGGARLARLSGAEGLSRVEVEEVLEPGARRLAVEVWPVAGGTRRGELELPSEAHCVRLLRDPFRATPRPLAAPNTGGTRFLRFSANGLRLLVGHEDGGVSALAVPHSPQATVPRPKRVVPRPGEQVVAFGWRANGGQLGLLRWENTLRLHGSLSKREPGAHAWTIGTAGPRLPEAGRSSLLMWSRPDASRRETPVVWDAQGDLYLLPREPHETPPRKPPRGGHLLELAASTLLAENVLALQVYPHGCFLVAQGPSERASRTLRVERLGDPEPRQLPLGGGVLAVHLGPGNLANGWEDGARKPLVGPSIAVGDPTGAWCLLRDGLRESEDEGVWLPPPPGRVVGLAWAPGQPKELALVVLDADQRTFSWWTAQGARPLTTAPGRVLSAQVGHTNPVLAWLTERGELGIWSLPFATLVFQSLPEARP